MVSMMNNHLFCIFSNESSPVVKRVTKLRIFFQNAILRTRRRSSVMIASVESRMIAHPPIDEKMLSPGALMPASPMKRQNIVHCMDTGKLVTGAKPRTTRFISDMPSYLWQTR